MRYRCKAYSPQLSCIEQPPHYTSWRLPKPSPQKSRKGLLLRACAYVPQSVGQLQRYGMSPKERNNSVPHPPHFLSPVCRNRFRGFNGSLGRHYNSFTGGWEIIILLGSILSPDGRCAYHRRPFHWGCSGNQSCAGLTSPRSHAVLWAQEVDGQARSKR
jgi:hypothetical protein